MAIEKNNTYKKIIEEEFLHLFKESEHRDVPYLEYIEAALKSINRALTLNKEVPSQKEIDLAANECSNIDKPLCEDEYWVIAKNEGFKDGAEWLINKIKTDFDNKIESYHLEGNAVDGDKPKGLI